MNSCTIRDLLRLALPFSTRLLTTDRGLKHPIQHAVGFRSTQPALPALRGGELVILSLSEALALDDQLTLQRIVERLLQVPVGAIAVAGVVDDIALDAAERAGLPLLHLPEAANPRQVEREVLYLLGNRELQIERRAAHLYSALTQQVALGQGIEVLLRTVGEATGRAAAFFGPAHELRLEWSSQVPPEIRFGELRPQQLVHAQRNGHPYLVKTVGPVDMPLGYLALGGSPLDAWDDSAAEQAASALLLELSKQQAVRAVETRVGGELLQTIVSGPPADMPVLQQQAKELGYDLRRPHIAMLIAPASNSLTADDIDEQLSRDLARRRITAPHLVRDGAVLCLLPVDEPARRSPQLLQMLAASLPLTAGISSVAATATEWQRAYAEARQALMLGSHLFGPRSLTLYADLRVYRLLFELRSTPDLWSFYKTTLGALVEYDQRHNGALLATLDGYFAAGGNLSQASEQLQIHRNTLLYRLRRIGQISGADIERPEDLLALQVALHAHRVLAAREGKEM